MSQGNYCHFAVEQDPHIVCNYLKRALRESREPLIPDQQYKALAVDGADIKSVIRTLPALNRSTLQLIVRLAKALVGYESKNKMTPYNVAITLGPNIFRAKVEDPNLETHKAYYDAFI